LAGRWDDVQQFARISAYLVFSGSFGHIVVESMVEKLESMVDAKTVRAWLGWEWKAFLRPQPAQQTSLDRKALSQDVLAT
jgi:hypothetical protein